MNKAIRGKAVVVFEHEGKFLFTDCYDHHRNLRFFIPVGGGIEFGEHSLEAARREAMEEIFQEIENERLLHISENIFLWNGLPEHEIVFVYHAEFKDRTANGAQLKGGIDSDGEQIKLVWASIQEIESQNISVYPEGLLRILLREYAENGHSTPATGVAGLS